MSFRLRRAVLLAAVMVPLGWTAPGQVRAQAAQAASTASAPAPTFAEADARRWLGYLASDLLQGRQVFTEGYGLASSYIAGELRAMGVEPLGDEGSYFQPVVRRGYRVTQQSRVTVTARGETRTFVHGDHVSFSPGAGGRQTRSFKGAEFLGYAVRAVAGSSDVAPERGAPGKLVLFLGGAPQALTSAGARVPRSLANLSNRGAALVEGRTGAGAAIGLSLAAIAPAPVPSTPQAGTSSTASAASPAPGGRGGATATMRDLTTTADVERLVAPSLVADETFFDFLLGTAGGGITALRAAADKGEPLPIFSLADVEVTVDVNAQYDVVSTERTQNVVAVVRGADPQLRSQYVMVGAHLDHVGYSTAMQARGRANTPVAEDGIWNGADDDGSGSTALLAIAKALQQGPRPKRSIVFVWHAGEEAGLIGSLHMAEHPVVPLDDVMAMFNIDMIGRNRDNDTGQADTVFVIGADRISTDLHNVIVEANARAPQPMRLDYEYNDVADPNSFYTRSDHYSYATKGVPSAFFFTGTHPDYHANTDTVDKILFPKLLRVTDLIYRSLVAVSDRPERLVRDNQGPRAGRGFSGPLGR